MLIVAIVRRGGAHTLEEFHATDASPEMDGYLARVRHTISPGEFMADFAKRAVVAVLACLVLVYVCDYGILQFRLSRNNGAGALGTVTSYYATALKDGRQEIFTDQPQTETCVRSLFPHSGMRPCWYASRYTVKPIG